MPRTSYRSLDGVHWCLRYITYFCRLIGILGGAGLWFTLIKLLSLEKKVAIIGWYMVAVTVFYTILELLWIIDKSTCCSDRGCCCCIFHCLVWLDSWRKTLIYAGLSVLMFMDGYRILHSLISGCILAVVAFFYFFMMFEYCHCFNRSNPQENEPLTPPPGQSENYTKPPEPAKTVEETNTDSADTPAE